MPPLIVIGMHRSGTSLFTKLLTAAGVYMGSETGKLHESRYHRKLNNWMLSQAGASWFDPAPFDVKLTGDQNTTLVEDVAWALTQDETQVYLGEHKSQVDDQPMTLEIPWGWKDPRTTVTLPIWLEQYPDAKIVHVYRHGLDVARSLYVRDAKRVQKEHRNSVPREPRVEEGRVQKSRHGLDQLTMDEGVELWADYSRRASRAIAAAGDRAVEIQYEEFLSNPTEQLNKVAKLYPLSLDNQQVNDMIATINVSRAYSWRQHDELRPLADQHSRTLAEFGYGSDG